MGKIFIGDIGYKLSLGDVKIKRGYLGSTLVYSGDITVTYHILDSDTLVPYQEDKEEGADCLVPYSFEPAGLRPGYSFLGWKLNKDADGDIIEVLTAGEDNIDLYAVYYKDYTVNFYNGSTTPITKVYRMYVNNENTSYPTTSEEDTTLINIEGFKNNLGWSDIIWNKQTTSFIQRYPDKAIIEIKSDMNLYSVYSANVSLMIVNGNGNSITKEPFSGIRYKQFNTSIYTKNPQINSLKHNAVSGWSYAETNSWCINGDTSKIINNFKDGDPLTISDNYDGKNICAIYYKNVSVTVFNARNARTDATVTRTRVCKSDGLVTIHPTYTLTHSNYESGWKDGGWNTVKNSVVADSATPKDGVVTITADSAITFYAIYKYDFVFTVYNYNNKSSSGNVTRRIQFYGNGSLTVHPVVNISHNNAPGWTPRGWSITTDKNITTYVVDDGPCEIKEFLGTKLYAMYNQNVKYSIVNGNATGSGGYKSDYNDIRTVKFCGSTIYINPMASLEHRAVSNWTYNGWNFGDNNEIPAPNLTIDYPNRTFEITSAYDNKTFYALYYYNIALTWHETTGSNTDIKPRYIRAIEGNWAITNPSFQRKIISLALMTIIGWSKSTAAVSSADYADNSKIYITSNTNLYSLYKNDVNVRYHQYGSVQTITKTRYFNGGSGASTTPIFSIPDPSYQDKQFLGWSTSSIDTTVSWAHFTNIPCSTDKRIFAVWQQNDAMLRDYRNEPNGYKSFYPDGAETFKAKIYRQNLVDIDTDWYDRVQLDIRNNITNGHWASATWCYVLLFAGPTPDMNNPHAQGQPTYTELRATNWWATGGINTDRGPLANNARATVTNTLTPTPGRGSISTVSYAYTDDWYIWDARFDIWTIKALGKRRTW